MRSWFVILLVGVVAENLSCGSSGGSSASGSSNQAAASALNKALSFVGGMLVSGALPAETAPSVTLVPANTQLAKPGADNVLLSFDLDNPDQAKDAADYALLQFEDSTDHFKVKLGAVTAGAGGSSDDSGVAGSADAGRATSDAGTTAATNTRNFSLRYSIQDSVCNELCDKTFTLTLVQAVSRKSGDVSAHATTTLTLDCTARGNHKLCAADETTVAAAGTGMAGAVGGAATSADGVVAVLVSPGAVTGKPIAITIKPAGSVPRGTIGRVYELGPSGTKFAKPVAVQYSYANVKLGNTDPASLRLATLDASGKKWQALSANQVDVARQVVTGDTTHFSPFGLIAAGDGANVDGGSVGVGGGGALGFTPSNVDLSGLDLSAVGDVVLSGTNCDLYSESQLWPCVDDKLVAKKIVTLPDQTRLSLFVVKSLRIEPSTVIRTNEHLPIVLVALDTMTLLGSIQVLPGTAGGAYNSGSTGMMKGQGPGGGASGTTDAAGGGGSFCGLGGRGATEGSAAGPKTMAYGTASLIPLQGGSAGGMGALVDSKGGGAIQLVAGTSFTLGPNAYISAGGAGGVFGGTNHQEACGGGSGGAILIESPTLTLSGTLAANGGGGGQGNGDSGAEASANDQAAKGGSKAASGVAAISAGGDGSAAAVINGADGTITDGYAAGGGGGGAGRIRINTRSGQADTSSVTLSPAKNSACLSVGTLAP